MYNANTALLDLYKKINLKLISI